ncbi:MAG: phosphotransferase [Holdemanella sp.]|nr:phosphotransferase [Holdemanella sp.]
MNKFEFDILRCIYIYGNDNQRFLSSKTGFSLGLVNKTIQSLVKDKYLKEDYTITNWSKMIMDANKPKQAIILAAGYGMRMIPINTEIPKGLLMIKNETLIERIIKQLHEVNIYDIHVVVGYMKEKYEFLIDEYGVTLTYNKDYSSKNNLFSVSKVVEIMENAYIVPCDIWFKENPFSLYEGYSWYLLSNKNAYNSFYTINRKQECRLCVNDGNKMIGIAYFHNQDVNEFKNVILDLIRYREYESKFWEESYKHISFPVYANLYKEEDYHEIDTFEDWRNLESDSMILSSHAIDIILKALSINANEIKDIHILKKGLTNHTFQFKVNEDFYVMRIPESDSNELINRYNERNTYQILKDESSTETIIYFDEMTGYKISKWIDHDHVCEHNNKDDLRKCMHLLRRLHEKKYPSAYIFDIFEKIQFYEMKWSEPSYYRDYEKTKENVFSLKDFIEENIEYRTLCHIDPSNDNFLIQNDDVYLIDWEYAAIQDPHIDIAMFCLDGMYDKKNVDEIIDMYFDGKCSSVIRRKIYAYISCCGLMWSNWTEYKRGKGIEFGEYSLKMYRYAKEYYLYAKGGD